jgi:type I protein arginine methyltransferase
LSFFFHRKDNKDKKGMESPSLSGGRKRKWDKEDDKEGDARVEKKEGSSLSSSIDKDYFDGYSQFHIHRDMLLDEPRTLAYKDAMTPEFFKDKIVLDVGSGTGILSLFAAQAGARRVVGVEANANLVQCATETAKENGFSDRIEFVCGRVEDIQTLPGGIEQVDIIVSEWMGLV